jgi:hypothetical protein
LGESRQTVQRLRSGAAAVAEAGAAMYALEAFVLAELDLASTAIADAEAGAAQQGEGREGLAVALGELEAWRSVLLAEEVRTHSLIILYLKQSS